MPARSTEIEVVGVNRGRVSVRPVDAVDPTASVRHVDQLAPAAKHQVPSLVEIDGPAAVAEPVFADLRRCDYLKFDRYYCVETADPR